MSGAVSKKKLSEPLPFPKVGDGLRTCLRCGRQLGNSKRSKNLTQAEREKRTGLCITCHQKTFWLKHGIQEGPKGSLIDYDSRDPNDVNRIKVKCGGPCGEWVFRELRAWSGHCYKCAHLKFRLTGERTNPNCGAKYFPDVRHPEHPDKVQYECLHCKSREFFVSLQIAKKLNWRGLCPHCRKLLGKLKNKEKNGNRYLFAQPDREGRVCIIAGKCKCKLWTTRASALTMYETGSPKTGRCREHFLNPDLPLDSGQANGNGQKDAEVKKVGAPHAFTDAEAWHALHTLPAVSFNALAKALGCSRATVRTWAREKGCNSAQELTVLEASGGGGKNSF